MPLLTIVFTDVVESSATKRDVSLGRDNRERDHAYLETVQTRHFNLVRASCEAHSGKEVSTMGDAFYLTFEDPVEAVRCAADIQRRLSANPIETPLGPLRLRIGIHSGFPEHFEGSWHGTDVDTAARVEATATKHQILISARTYELVRHMTDVRFHFCGEFALKGVDRMALWEADWDSKGPRPTSTRPLGVAERKRKMQRRAMVFVAAVLLATGTGYVIRRYATGDVVARAKPRQSVAVLSFKNLGSADADWLANALPEMLNTELSAGAGLRMISGEDVAKTTTDLAVVRMPSYGRSTLEKLRSIWKSDYVIAGAYAAAGKQKSDSVRLDLRLQDASTGDIVSSFPESGTIDTLPATLKRIGAAVRAKLRIQEPSESQAAQAQASLPDNPEVTRLYTEGLAKIRNFDALEAKDPLDRAIALEPKLAAPHSALAQAWQLLGYDSNAREEAKKAVDLSANLSPVDQRSIEGRYRELTAEWDKAIEIYRSLWGVFQDEPNYALDLAKAQTAAGKGQDALATLADLQRLPQMTDDPRIDLARAFAAQSLSDVKQQQSAAAAAAEKASRLGSRYLAAQAYWLECGALYALGEFEKGITACQQSSQAAPFALEIAARTQTVLANIMLAQGHPTEALEMRRQALDTARKIGSQKDVIGALDNLANLVDVQGNTRDARRYFDEAFRVAHEIDDKQQLLLLENDYAADLYGDGDFSGAEDLYRKSLATAQEIGDQQGTAIALQNLSLVAMMKGDLATSQQQIEQAIAIQRQAGLQSDLANSLVSLGDLLLTRGDFSDARKSYEESLKLSTDLHTPVGIASSQLSIANVALTEGKPSDAAALAEQAAASFQREKLVDQEAGARNVLARSLFAQGKIPDAQAEASRALSLSPQDRTVRLSLAITAARLKARSGKATDARKELEACMADAVKMKLVGTAFDIQLAQAEVLAASDLKSALARLQALQGDAKAKGYLRVATDAERARQDLARRGPQSG
jgi:class 3 adenylate cyclase/tetratricopeptide (TPR) repeat protein